MVQVGPIRLIRRLAKASAGELRDLVLAEVALVRARALLRLRRRGALLSFAAPDDGARGATQEAPLAHDLLRAQALALAVRRAAVHGPVTATCLPRALATCFLLEREALTGARIRIGVRRTAANFVAHAWVEFRGVRLVDSDEDLASYSEVESLGVRLGP